MALNHTHKPYDNFVLAAQFEDQYDTKLDLMQFCTVDTSLEGVAGDTKKINVYTATSGTEILEMGAGNTKNIEVSHSTVEHTIEMMQVRFPYYDEEQMRDPKIVEKGLNHMAVDMFNTSMSKCMAEFNKATLSVSTNSFSFNAFVDAVAAFPKNEKEDISIFGLVHRTDMAEVRKQLKDDLKYVEAFVRTGYVGTVAGVNLYLSDKATAGEIVTATRDAVTYFSKKGTEIEQERDPNIRLNTVYARKYGIFALTDATRAVKIVKSA